MDLVDFKVSVVRISEIVPHPNADKLELCKFEGLGWQCVIQKDRYKVGDAVIYIPVDSILSEDLDKKLFPPDSKIRLNNRRVKAIKIRQFISQGMVISLDFLAGTKYVGEIKVGIDVASALGITKYEPPAPKFQGASNQGGPAPKKKQNPNFHVYSKFPRIENYPLAFKPEDMVVITEKIHGTNFRAGWVPFVANTLWRKFLKLVKLAPEWQFVYGTHYVQLSDKLLYDGYYKSNVYAEMVKKYDLENLIAKGDVIYGEIYGAGIQKGYNYSLADSRDLVIFDIMRNNKYLGYEDFKKAADSYGLKRVPLLFKGEYGDIMDVLDKVKTGTSVLDPNTAVREGCVIKSLEEGDSSTRQGVKCINPAYLLQDTTDNH